MGTLKYLKHMKHQKASEFQIWLPYYFLPLQLFHKPPPLFYHNFALLVCATHIIILYILKYDLDMAEEILICALLPELFGKENLHQKCSPNTTFRITIFYIHMWGPSWTIPASLCQTMLKNWTCMYHMRSGTTQKDNQISKSTIDFHCAHVFMQDEVCLVQLSAT